MPSHNDRKTSLCQNPLRDASYRAWVREQTCVVCPIDPEGSRLKGGPVEAAHTVNNGMGSKGPDSSCVPLCAWHHRLQHAIGRNAFERRFGIDLRNLAAAHFARFSTRLFKTWAHAEKTDSEPETKSGCLRPRFNR